MSYARVLRIFLPVFLHLERLQAQHKDHPVVGTMLIREGVKDAILQDMRHFRIPVPFEDKKELEVRCQSCTVRATLTRVRLDTKTMKVREDRVYFVSAAP